MCIKVVNQVAPKQFRVEIIGKTKTPTVKKGFDVSSAESTRIELVHPS